MEEREKNSGGVGCFLIGAVLVLLPVLYVFGLGPAASLSQGNPAAESVFAVLYYPLLILGENFPPVGDAIDWYFGICGVAM